MALTFKKLFQPQLLSNVAGTIYTVDSAPATTLLRNGRVRVTNTDSVAHAVTLNAVPVAGSSSATNKFLPGTTVGPNTYIDVDIPQMSAGDFISGSADLANVVNVQAIDGYLQS